LVQLMLLLLQELLLLLYLNCDGLLLLLLLLLVRLPELQVGHAQPSGQRGIADGRRCHACWLAEASKRTAKGCQRGLWRSNGGEIP
jgi:hypothetical protein